MITEQIINKINELQKINAEIASSPIFDPKIIEMDRNEKEKNDKEIRSLLRELIITE